MKQPSHLYLAENNWETRMGKSFPGERVIFRGKNLFTDLKDLSWMQLYLFGITGRQYNDKQARLFEGMWSLCASYPDSYLWNNRIGSLSGSFRSTGSLALGAAIALSEASIYGRRPDIMAIDFLLQLKRKIDHGANLADIVRSYLKNFRNVPGYGRPIVNKDERILPLHALAKEQELAGGPHTQLAFLVEEFLLNNRLRMRMNVAALGAALAADLGLSAQEYYLFLIPCFTAGIMPCFIEASEKPEGTFLPIRCSGVTYHGIAPRQWAPSDIRMNTDITRSSP